jgi:hypothetical protein
MTVGRKLIFVDIWLNYISKMKGNWYKLYFCLTLVIVDVTSLPVIPNTDQADLFFKSIVASEAAKLSEELFSDDDDLELVRIKNEGNLIRYEHPTRRTPTFFHDDKNPNFNESVVVLRLNSVNKRTFIVLKQNPRDFDKYRVFYGYVR